MSDTATATPAVGTSGATNAERYRNLTDIRVQDPGAIRRAADARTRRGLADGDGRLMIIACDHPARGANGVGNRPLAMGNRIQLLERLETALSRPGVDGLLASPDILEDLLLLGALEGKVVFGSMNRGGLAGAVFELDDRFTGYTAAAIARDGLNGGKMMLRVADDDSGTVRTMEACAAAIDALGALGLHAMIEVFASRTVDGRSSNDPGVEATMRAIAVASALGGSSARTWLKLPVVDDQERLLSATTLPVVLLGGDPGKDRDATYARWAKSMSLPQVRGLVAGRTLLYPPDGDVRAAVDAAAKIVRA
jgi:hypothetical protein